MFEHILRNLPEHKDWEGSFYEQLTEYGTWNKQEFWLLHRDLILAAHELKDAATVDTQLAAAIVRLQANVDRLFIAHFDQNDVFKILDLSVDETYAFKERFEMAVVGVFSGNVLAEHAFELVNPLL